MAFKTRRLFEGSSSMNATTTFPFASTATAEKSAVRPAVLTRTGGWNVSPWSVERANQITLVEPFCDVKAMYGFPEASSARTPFVATAPFVETFRGGDHVRPRSVERRYRMSEP